MQQAHPAGRQLEPHGTSSASHPGVSHWQFTPGFAKHPVAESQHVQPAGMQFKPQRIWLPSHSPPATTSYADELRWFDGRILEAGPVASASLGRDRDGGVVRLS